MQPQTLTGGEQTAAAPLPPSNLHATAAVYDTHQEAEKAVRSLQQAGFDMKKLSIVGKEYVGALAGTVVEGGLSAFGVGLFSIGIPQDSVLEYEAQVRAGKFVVIAHGTTEEVRDIAAALRASNHHGLRNYARSGSALIEGDRRADYVRRDTILKLLSDQEAASVSTAETAAGLAASEQYLDLQQLDHGVQFADEAALPMGRVLPRNAVSDETWNRIVAQLAPASA